LRPRDDPTQSTHDATAFTIVGRVDCSMVSGLCNGLRSLIAQSDADRVVCDVTALSDCDLVAIDMLARLGLTARRLGRTLELCGASDTLVELIALVGLGEILPLREP
jgi:ABC-type transporter Mla MlaB component